MVSFSIHLRCDCFDTSFLSRCSILFGVLLAWRLSQWCPFVRLRRWTAAVLEFYMCASLSIFWLKVHNFVWIAAAGWVRASIVDFTRIAKMAWASESGNTCYASSKRTVQSVHFSLDDLKCSIIMSICYCCFSFWSNSLVLYLVAGITTHQCFLLLEMTSAFEHMQAVKCSDPFSYLYFI